MQISKDEFLEQAQKAYDEVKEMTTKRELIGAIIEAQEELNKNEDNLSKVLYSMMIVSATSLKETNDN